MTKATHAWTRVSASTFDEFATRIIAWQRLHGRNDLPWQASRDPYAIWISEVMLQQTQVSAVIPYYRRFLERFPDCAALASATLDEVLRSWSGLGYYSRARNLHQAAQIVVQRHAGRFPRSIEAIAELPGVGRSTAAAIAAFAFGAREAILDGNVRRVLARVFGVEGDLTKAAQQSRLWTLAERLLPARDIGIYTQGLMDLGATVCVRRGAKCGACPVLAHCFAHRTERVDELPQPRTRKALPMRETTMLLLLHKARVLLERRPAAGIWGALWSLPELALDGNPEEACRMRFGVQASALTQLPSIEHGFTHFRLRIHPLRVDVRSLEARVEESGRIWLPLAEAIGAAIPVPVRRILKASVG